ncbi:DUF4132 domain-containing protein [Yoonia sp. F2084L]|uniref:DUF4132 domain-containing protein n=1 Tax=Yoonia sp. F2084L TaxID=2926419 RepID=UPI001FF53F71|nr:DUF4132 domain-containing protein [Yoonia sp. F2084L]MCK0097303.1 DUF4132 domain-containing protein [Yoonia sp. F2084L]
MKSLLSRLNPFGDATTKLITHDLSRLNKVKAGMGDTAVTYVLRGEPETVLSTLTQAGGGQQLQVGVSYVAYNNTEDCHLRRQLLFLDMAPFNADLLARYAQVLAASMTAKSDRLVGSAKTPAALRVLLTEVAIGACDPGKRWQAVARETPPKGLTLDQLVPMTQALDGTIPQLFETLFWDNNEYGTPSIKPYRDLIDLRALVLAHTGDALKGVAKSPAQGREAFVKALHKWKLSDQQPFLDFVLASAGDPSKSVRAAAVSVLRNLSADTIAPLAAQHLAKGTVGVRAGMVEILAGLGTEAATETLRAHLKTEKTARIIAAIENSFSAGEMTGDSDQPGDDATGYTAIDGSRVEIPPLQALQDGPALTLTAEDRKQLKQAIAAQNEKTKAHNAKYPKGYQAPTLGLNFMSKLEAHFGDTLKDDSVKQQVRRFLISNPGGWTAQALDRMAEKQALTFGFRSIYHLPGWISPYRHGPFEDYFQKYLASDHADLRAIDALWQEMGVQITVGGWGDRRTRKAAKGDVLRQMMPEYASVAYDAPAMLSDAALWPYIADNFDVMDHAMGVSANTDGKLSQTMAIRFLAALPKTPMRYFVPLLEVATGERKTGKAEARALLADVPQVTDRLITLLKDSRQVIRKGAAEWLGARGNAEAIPALKAQLKKDKSELAKAAILTALEALGEPLDSYVGPAALIREAEAGLKKAKFDKLEWLKLDHMPPAKFKNGKAVPADVLKWWLYLAFKLKQPGGNALFEIYLDQLAPDSAASFSQWIFDSWMTYDTVVPSDEEAIAHADKHIAQRQQSYKRWYPDMTRDQIYAQLKREMKSQYQNTGAATKGILALASRVPSQIAADRVRTYLRNHGSRTSQASSLLEVLAHKGDPVSLQVVIAAATRLKQKGVQAFASELVQRVADTMNWSLDELADRTIPAAGMNDDGFVDLPCGVEGSAYRATLGDDLTFVLTNPDGKVVKALSSGTDEATKAAKKQLSASKKELKQVVTMQTARLYEALCGERVWPLADWQRDLADHPIMRRLVARVVWQGLDADGRLMGNFRPTIEGEFTDAQDADVDISRFAGIRLAHGATLSAQEADQWATHLQDYEVKPLFAQFGRSLIRLPDDQRDAVEIVDRKGWVTETFALRGAATKLGYERGQTEDGGWFYNYHKSFKGVGLTATIEFTGNYLPEENRNAALISLSFEKAQGRYGQKVKLSEVPPVLLSECWNDFHAMAAKASYDPDWEKNVQW